MVNSKKLKTQTWFISWFKYFEAYLELARIGVLQLEQQKYNPENLFKKDSLYTEKNLLLPIVWCLKHSVELLLKILDIRIANEFLPVHDNNQLHHEMQEAFFGIGIKDHNLLNELKSISYKYLTLTFWDSLLLSNGQVQDVKNDIFRYPESGVNFKLNIEDLQKVTKHNQLELRKDIEILSKLVLKLDKAIRKQKVKSYMDFIFSILENKRSLPALDLHGTRPEDVETEVINFFSKQIKLGHDKIQIIYGHGGKGILRNKTKEVLAANMAEKETHKKFVKDWREAEQVNAGARCLVLLEVD